jgi:hypothetical protein
MISGLESAPSTQPAERKGQILRGNLDLQIEALNYVPNQIQAESNWSLHGF